MVRGIIYVMTTAVPGLIKIGKTGRDNFEQRMYQLERHGYNNITSLQRRFAIEVEDYDDKEKLIDDIFSKSKVQNAELYAVDVELVVQLLSSFEGNKIFPKDMSKEEVFDEATRERKINADSGAIPDGEYFYTRKISGFGEAKGKAVVEDGVFKVLKGAYCAPVSNSKSYVPKIRKTALIKNNILEEDIICNSPTAAGWVISGKSNNGWSEWKDSKRKSIDSYRKG